jgi:hypothetical protein
MALGDYNQYRANFRDVSTDYDFLAATDYTTAQEIIPAKAKHEIMIQRIVLAVTTDNAALQTFQNNVATPDLIAKSKASPGIGVIEWDFGPVGVSCQDGQSFQHLMSATGMAGRVSVLAYLRPTRNVARQASDI